MGDRSNLRIIGPDRRAPEYWRDLAERLAGDPDVALEFAPGADQPPDGLSRRSFLGYLGASMALAGATACGRSTHDLILPYSRQPPAITPGVPLHYATSLVIGGYGVGVICRTNEGRPTKVEGNPDHPASLGGTSALHQAEILQLYDPHRAGELRELRSPRSWRAFARAIAPDERPLASESGPAPPPAADGAGLHFLLEPTSSPSIADLIRRVRARYPRAEFHFHDPLASEGAIAGSRATFRRVLVPQYHFDLAEVVVALDADFLGDGPMHVRWARDFMRRRRISAPDAAMNRLYVVESGFSGTGVVADHRLARTGSEVGEIAAEIAAEVLRLRPGARSTPELRAALTGRATSPFARAVARDLVAHAGRGVVLAGDRQPPAVHALAHLVNDILGNAGETVHYTAPAIFEAGEASHDLRNLVRALDQGRVQRLVILGGNPAYTAPADLDLPERIAAVPTSAYLGPHENETAARARWFVPLAHDLESWGDARAYDGTISILQPMIEPLHNGRTVAEVLSVFLGEPEFGPHEIFRRFWQKDRPGAFPRPLSEQYGFGRGASPVARGGVSSVAPPDASPSWLGEGLDERLGALLRRGVLEGSAFGPEPATVDAGAVAALVADLPRPPPPAGGLELAIFPDSRVRDGSFTNVPWLLELPEPLTKLVWENAAVLSPGTARALGLETDDRVELALGERRVQTRAFVLPGHPDSTVSVTLGWGRSGGERNAAGLGFNAYALRTSTAPYFARGLAVRKLAVARDRPNWKDRELAEALVTTQRHGTMEGRPLVLSATLAEYRKNPGFTANENERTPTVRAAWPAEGNQWAMVVDLSACDGCNACVVACQAENNVPVVGKVNVRKGREMHWLRIDRYFSGPPESPAVVMQPMACQHCERAPCEYVCPVNATVHSFDGLNDMVYNRCVGTRFCSNNCPYKVRRFNWFNFHQDWSATERMAMNPDVTVRERGVMEKCTYCVQRIREADIRSRIERRPIRDGEVVPACAQACPTEAIAFGNINDPKAVVTGLRELSRAYAVLNDTGSEPRTRYLARITNPNPELETSAEGAR